MHQLLIAGKGAMTISHKNKNVLDNRKENLILIPFSLKVHGARKSQGKSSKYKGVTFQRGGHSRDKKWSSTITKDKKAYFLGCFKTEKEAARAYNEKAFELYGELAYQNKIE